MREAILSSILLASSIACTGCSSGGDGEGSGGSGGSGSTAALSFDAESSLPAAGGAAAAIAFAAQFGNTLSSILNALGNEPEAASFPVTQKIDASGFLCKGGGSADLTGEVTAGEEVRLDFSGCVGSAFGAGSVSGDITLTINSGTRFDPINGGPIYATAVVDLEFSSDPMQPPDATLLGTFDAFAEASAGLAMINLRLGNQLDSDLLTLSEGQEVLQLGCFDISQRVSQFPPGFVVPLGVANLAGEIFTINDYAASTNPRIDFDSNGVPSKGDMTLHSGDGSAAMGSDRSVKCPGPEFPAPVDTSSVVATFSSGGCIDLQGVNKDGPFQNSTTWDKLLDRDFTGGSGPGCGGGMPVTCDDPTGAVVEIIDSDFQDSNWEVEIVATEGAVYDAPIERRASGGFGDTPFRQMTHTIESATNSNCAESCTLGVVHKIATTYNPRGGAIDHIDYTEAQKIITPGHEGAQVGWAFAVVQDERRYNGPATTAFGVTDWTINGLCGLTAEDFGPKDGPHPDFSEMGSELTFAYIRSNSNTSDIAAVTNVHGIDDFRVVIVQEPPLP